MLHSMSPFVISLFLKFPHLMLLDTHKKMFFNFSSFRLLTLRGLFWFPGYRELFLSTGACAATKEGMENLLRYQCYKTQDISGRIVLYSMKHRFFIYVNFISPRYMSITIYAIILWHGTNSDVYWGLPVFRYKTESNEIYEPKIYLFCKCNIFCRISPTFDLFTFSFLPFPFLFQHLLKKNVENCSNVYGKILP